MQARKVQLCQVNFLGSLLLHLGPLKPPSGFPIWFTKYYLAITRWVQWPPYELLQHIGCETATDSSPVNCPNMQSWLVFQDTKRFLSPFSSASQAISQTVGHCDLRTESAWEAEKIKHTRPTWTTKKCADNSTNTTALYRWTLQLDSMSGLYHCTAL